MSDMNTQNDVAVIGLACRFPGEASSPQRFFEMLCNGRSARAEIPADRFNINAYWHPSYDRQGTIVTKHGYFLEEDVSRWDAPFFSMTAAEANAMDPQHRMLLEVAYESMENAGLPMNDLVGSDTACYVGAFTKDYEQICTRDLGDKLLYTGTGNGPTMLANRISWFYDLRGASVSLDTACSSSLVTVHLACQDILSNRSTTRVALAGGVSLILAPDMATSLSALHFLSPDGRSYSFDARANGYARGEGCSFLVLKHVDDAIRDGDTIRAIIRGTGVNQDGKTPGISLPSSEAQAALIESTYKAAGLTYSDTGFFEAHGTGTAAGDPLETSSIGATFGRDKNRREPLWVGSLKSNVGHLEGTAGVAGVVKGILSLESGLILPQHDFQKPNPKIRTQEWKIRFPTEPVSWPSGKLRRMSVNSFGYGGTNAHAIIDDAYNYLKDRGLVAHHNTTHSISSPALSEDSAIGTMSTTSGSDGLGHVSATIQPNRFRLFTLSSPEQAALSRMASQLCGYLQDKSGKSSLHSDEILYDLAYTLGNHRSTFQWRIAALASDTSELIQTLPDAARKPFRSTKPPRMVWIFNGQGAQWARMGVELMEYRIFSASVLASDDHLKSIGADWSVADEMRATVDVSRVNNPRFSQPLCAILQVATVDLLRHWGLQPHAVMGHSSGEIAAAYALGAISAQDAWTIAYHRGRLSEDIQTLAPLQRGAMMSVGLSEEEVRPYLARYEPASLDVVVACINSPSNVTLSGSHHVLTELEQQFQAENVFVRTLKVENAYHSPHMQVIAKKYLDALVNVETRPVNDEIKMFSSVTGAQIQASQLGAEYWVNNMVQPVQFVKALDQTFETVVGERRKRKHALRIDCAIEIGPHSALKGPLMQFLTARRKAEGTSYYSILSRNEHAIKTALTSIGSLWSLGAKIDLQQVNGADHCLSRGKVLVDLPSYPWNHTNSYWHESSQSRNHRFRKTARMDYLGAPVEDFNPRAPLWKNVLRKTEVPWIADHKIQSDIIFPGAGMICTALEAARQLVDPARTVNAFEFRDIVIARALVIPGDDQGVEIFLNVKPRKMGMKGSPSPWYEFTFYSLERDGTHNEHSSGLLQILYETDASEIELNGRSIESKAYRDEYELALQECTKSIDRDYLYSIMKSAGLNYGPTFRGLTNVKAGKMVACTVVTIPDTRAVMPSQYESEHLLHPATLDAFFQSSFPAYLQTGNLKEGMIPTGIGRLWISAYCPQGAGNDFNGMIRISKRGFREMNASITMMDSVSLQPAVIIRDYVATSVGSQSGQIEAGDPTEILRSKVCNEIIYKPDVDLIEASHAQKLLGHDSSIPDSFSDWAESSSQAAAIYIRRCLKSISQQTIANLEGSKKLYYEWMKQLSTTTAPNGLLIENGSTVESSLSVDGEDSLVTTFSTTYPQDGRLLKALSINMDAILKGDKSTLDASDENDVSILLPQEGGFLQSAYSIMKEWFDLAGHKNPDLRILEVNAGIKSFALPVLQTLGGQAGSTARFSSYTFTDSTSEPFERARNLLNDWSGLVDFKKLDILADPVDFGFEMESIDVVVLSTFLVPPERIASALGNCFKLLKPGGKLVVCGCTRPSDWLTFVLGATTNSWTPDSYRPGSSFFSTDRLRNELVGVGFSGVDVSVHDSTKEHTQSISVTVSSKPIFSEKVAVHDFVVLRAVNSDPQKSLSEALSQQLRSSHHQVVETTLQEIGLEGEKQLQIEGKVVVSLLELDQVLLAYIGLQDFDTVKKVIQEAGSILWVTCTSSDEAVINPYLRTINGLFKGISADNEGVRLHALHLHRNIAIDVADTAALVVKSLITNLSTDDDLSESDTTEQDGRLTIPRHYDEKNANHRLASIDKPSAAELQPLLQRGRPLKLTIGSPGILDTLHFVDDPVQSVPLPDDFVEVEVKANAMNFVDVMVAMGQVPDMTLGLDVAGVVTQIGSKVTCLSVGDRVTFSEFGAFANVLRVPAALPQKLPDNLTYEEGSAIPIVWTTAYHALVQVAHLQRGETVLIHAAAGGLGLTLIQLAHHLGAEIYATVGTPAKRNLIMSMGVAEDHIFSSRDLTFAEGILQMTNGQGVDVVVNSLAGEALRKSWECVTDFGRFIEVGKKDILENTGLEMMPFLKNVTFTGVNIEHMLRKHKPRWIALFKMVMDLFHRGIAKVVQPITVHDWSEMEICFRTMQQGRHVGKLVMKMTSESKGPVIPRDPHPVELRSDSAYVLVGGLGGLGRGQAIRLAERGARYIAFLSRSGASTAKARETLEQLESKGVKAVAYECDIADKESLAQTLARVTEELAPIKGVVQGAAVFADCVFENMTYEKWLAATRPKIQGTWNLHELIPKDVDFFVILSSVVGSTGGRTQPNYAAGNAFQDALAHYRRSQGLPVQAVDLGIIAGMGYIEENKDNAELAWVTAMEMISIKPPQFYAIFESAITGYSHGEHRLPPQITMGAGSGGLDIANQAAGSSYQLSWLYRFAQFAYLKKLDLRGAATSDNDDSNEIKSLLSNATSTTQASDAVQNAITAKLAKAMMISGADIDPTKPLHHYGVDSLVAVEVRNWIIRELKSDVSIFDILASIPIAQLAVKIVGKSRLVPVEIRGDGEAV